jgi:hypothetical protein
MQKLVEITPLINAMDVLSRLFEKIYAPVEVRDELARAATPTLVKTWMQPPPQWLEIVSASLDSTAARLQKRVGGRG